MYDLLNCRNITTLFILSIKLYKIYEYMLYYIYRITHIVIRNYKRNGLNYTMKISEMSTEKMLKTSYMTYKRMYDFENGTSYAKQHYEMQKINKTLYKMNAHNAHNAQTEIATTTHENESTSYESTSIEYERVETNNGQQRDIIGNYNDNRVMIKKTLNHLNAMKRAMSISQQTNDEKTKLRNENIMYRELLNLELSIRTMNKNIIENNE